MKKLNYSQAVYHKHPMVSHPNIANGKTIKLQISLRGWDGKPDCEMGSFSQNFWFRTSHGIHYKKYKTEAAMTAAVKRLLLRHGFNFTYYFYEEDCPEKDKEDYYRRIGEDTPNA